MMNIFLSAFFWIIIQPVIKHQELVVSRSLFLISKNGVCQLLCYKNTNIKGVDSEMKGVAPKVRVHLSQTKCDMKIWGQLYLALNYYIILGNTFLLSLSFIEVKWGQKWFLCLPNFCENKRQRIFTKLFYKCYKAL